MDIKTILKKFFSYFKRAKNPVKNIEEAQEVLKETKTYLMIFGGIGVVSVILSTILDAISLLANIFMFLALVGIFLAIYFGLMYSALNRIIKRMQNLTCDKCGEKLGDLANTTYKEISRRWVDSNNSNPPSSTLKVTVKFTCTCSKCGAVKSFTEELRSGAVTSKGSNLISTEKLVEDYLKGFIHA